MSTLVVTRNELDTTLPAVCRFNDKSMGRWRKQTVVMVGPPGTGKTTLVFSMARNEALLKWYNELTDLELSQIPVYKTPCHPDATAPEVYGQYLPIDGVWTFIPGAMLRAWGYNWHREHVADKATGYDEHCKTPPPGVHLLDDIHLMGPGGQSAMYLSFDNGVGASFMDPFGKLVFPHEAALVFGTMNGEIDSLDPAVVDRTAIKVPVMEPSEQMLAALDDEMMQACCEADYTNNMDPTATYREWQSISQLRPIVGLHKAALLALGKEDRSKKLIEALAKAEGSGLFPGAGREARDALNSIIKATPV